MLRLLNPSLGGQAGWLLGFAVVAGLLVLTTSRLRRADARTGWLIAAGGAFVTIAVAYSSAEGIFHPYYVSLLAPFTAVLVGAGAAELHRGGRAARIAAPVAIAAGVVVELAVLDDNQDTLDWLPPVLAAAGVIAAIALAGGIGSRGRGVVVAAVLGLLLLAPATWAVQTLGHATNGTFPAGGPVAAGMMGGPGGMAARPWRDGARATPPAGAGGPMFGPPGGQSGGPFGGSSGSLTEAVSYARQHGGGTLAVASQSGAAGQLISKGADVAALGGFSGRESQVSIAWLADAVEQGRIRWVLTEGAGGMPSDGRVGASDIMAVVADVGTPVDEVSGLYDLQGLAQELRASSG